MIYAIGKAIFHLVNVVGFNFTIRGKENIPKTGSLIICPNHVSLYDPILIGTQVRRPVHFLAKAELFKNAFAGKVMRAINTIPVDRGNVSMSTLKAAMKVLKDGGVLGVFPEGTRVRGDQAQKPKPMEGFVVFALKTKSPILPVHIEGKFKFRGKVTITFGKPISLEAYYGKKVKHDEMARISEDIMSTIYSIE
jgi:1-acyl-sn-glycerol-3-phosphate acyltransferase